MTDTTSRKRQPRGTTVGGQFATEAKGESAVSLSNTYDTSYEERTQAHTAEIVERFSHRNDEHYFTEEFIGHRMDNMYKTYCDPSLDNPVPVSYVADFFAASEESWREPYSVASDSVRDHGDIMSAAYDAGMPSDWLDRMAALDRSHQEDEDARFDGRFTERCVNAWADGTITDKTLRVLQAEGLADTASEARMYAGHDLEYVKEWRDAREGDQSFNEWTFTSGDGKPIGHDYMGRILRSGMTVQDARLAQAQGMPVGMLRALSQSTRLPQGTSVTQAISELSDYRRALYGDAEITDDKHADTFAYLYTYNASPDEVKACGSTLNAQDFGQIRKLGVDPAVFKSMRARRKSLPVSDISELSKAGITTGAQYAAWSKVAPSMSKNQLLRSAILELTPDQAQSFVGGDKCEPETAAVLVRAGLDTPQKATGLTVERSEWPVREDSRRNHFDDVAAFIEAGGTPQEATRISRAGIPIHEGYQFIGHEDRRLWELGAPFRENIKRFEQQYVDRGESFGAVGSPWPYSAETLSD